MRNAYLVLLLSVFLFGCNSKNEKDVQVTVENCSEFVKEYESELENACEMGSLGNCPNGFPKDFQKSFSDDRCFGIVTEHLVMDIDRGKEYHTYIEKTRKESNFTIEWSDRNIRKSKLVCLTTLQNTGENEGKCNFFRHGYSGLIVKVYTLKDKQKIYHRMKVCYSDYGHRIQVEDNNVDEFNDLVFYILGPFEKVPG